MSCSVVPRGRLLMLLTLSVALGSCQSASGSQASRIATTSSAPKTRLRALATIAVVIPKDSRSYTLVGTAGVGRSTDGATSGVDLVRKAADLLRFELQKIGFRLSSDTVAVDAIAEFSIGKLRFDSQRGWLAEEAILVFRRPGTPESVAAFRASARTATPGADSLVVALGRVVKRQY